MDFPLVFTHERVIKEGPLLHAHLFALGRELQIQCTLTALLQQVDSYSAFVAKRVIFLEPWRRQLSPGYFLANSRVSYEDTQNLKMFSRPIIDMFQFQLSLALSR